MDNLDLMPLGQRVREHTHDIFGSADAARRFVVDADLHRVPGYSNRILTESPVRNTVAAWQLASSHVTEVISISSERVGPARTWPTIPSVSPRATSNETSRSAQKSDC